MKKIIGFISICIVGFLVSCGTITTTKNIDTTHITNQTTTEANTTTTTLTTEPEDEILELVGVDDAETILNHYFNPIKGVSATSKLGQDITSLLKVEGYVDYGTVGEYELIYTLNYNNDDITIARNISVVEGDYLTPDGSRPPGFNGYVGLGDGSYSTGTNTFITHPIDPMNIENDLLPYAIPSSGWWTTLLVDNYGGGNGIYLNPLRTAFSNEGMEITNPQDGFVQYWNPDGYQTMAQFPIAIKDLFLKSNNLDLGYHTEVIDYSDYAVKVAMRNNGSYEDEVVVTLAQGSPYVFAETADKQALTITLEQGAQVNYYDLEGNVINGGSFLGDGMVMEYVQRHSGYDCSPPANVGQPEYSDKYYLVNTPANTQFTITNNVLSMSLGDGNFISVAAINNLSETLYYHNHGYHLPLSTSVDYDIDYDNSNVYTNYIMTPQTLRNDLSSQPLQALMPHQYKNSNATLTDYFYRTVRGSLYIMEGNYFQTTLDFNGLVPGYTLPTNSEFSALKSKEYLDLLNDETEYTDTSNYYNDEGPYWNSKALYPLAQGIIIADQLGEDDTKLDLIGKLRYLLEDWYTFDGTSDDRYLYYNNNWGSVYYSNDDFGTASGLSDHSFTHGYLIYASAVLAMYDSTFVDEYELMVDLLLDDYMSTDKKGSSFEYLRNFDPWAGHSWAHGFGNFAEGNNLESTSEALNSWVGGYLWALAVNDTTRMEAAIYGFVTEMNAIKEYWFDYDEENWDPDYGDYVDVAGIVWGGKHDYATWFGANPTYIYGIQWLPTGEFLTNYAINDKDYTKFSSIYQTYLDAKNGEIDTWFSNMWTIQAIINPTTAIQQFNESLILADDYPAEIGGSYWMINALQTLGRRTTDIWMKIDMGVSSSIYEDSDGNIYAMIWNVSDMEKTVVFYSGDQVMQTVLVSAKEFVTVQLD